MKSFIAIASLAVSANALVGRSDSCCFHLTASGDVSGSLGQLNDGQVRVGDNSLSPAKFCLSGGVITDSEGRGCVVTSETTQFQCDAGSAGTSGFSLSSSGGLEFKGKSNFVACATGQNNGDNIYITQSDSVTQCVSIKLVADSTCAAPSSSAISSSAPVATSMPGSSSSMSASSPAPSGSSPVGGGSGSSSSAAAPATSTPVAGSSSLLTKTSSSAMTSSSSAAATGASSATSASSTVAPASSSVAASAATKFGMGNFATAMVVLSMASLYLI